MSRKRHGHTWRGGSTNTYRSWSSMKARCRNPDDPNWHRYGGRGITVCDRWFDSFEAFLADMGEAPAGLTLERLNNDLGYEPGNCVWATRAEQGRNRRTTKLSSQDVEAIRTRLSCGELVVNLAAEFSVHPSLISLIKHYKVWR